MSQYHGLEFDGTSDPFLAPFDQEADLPFSDVLDIQKVQDGFDEHNVSFGSKKGAIFTPTRTLWVFVLQMLSPGMSCVKSAAKVSTLLVVLGLKPCAGRSSAYCRARAKLPAALIRELTCNAASDLELQIPEQWKFVGRTVKLIDGTTIIMPDTAENQEQFPQPKSQEPGLGYPMMRLLLVFSMATGMVCNACFGPCAGKETAELALLRQILDSFSPEDILLADRFFCSFFMIALVLQRGAQVVFRQHQRRHTDFRRGRSLGKGDHVVVWKRPARPEWMDEETYASIPETLILREVSYQVHQKGFRTEELVVVTNILDPEELSAGQITELYGKRWLAELDIRDNKTTMGMDRLCCMTPFMIEKELWAHLLGYNMVRKVIAQAAMIHGRLPRQYSFKTAMDVLETNWQPLSVAAPAQRAELWWNVTQLISGVTVGNRPGRCEPRAKKYRGKSLPLLPKPRGEAKAELHAA